LFNTERTAQKGYALVNSQLSYRFADDRYGVSLWGKNIFNKYYARYSLDLSGNGFDYTHLADRSEEHTSELQSLMRISYAVFCLQKKKNQLNIIRYIAHR